MKVAIIGAGLSGMYCAHELERLGLRPDIYERNNFIGEPYSHVTAILGITHRPFPDLLAFYRKKLKVDVRPLRQVKVLEHHSPNKTATLKGNFGYFFEYSREEHSIKNQLFNQLKKSRLFLNEFADYQKLAKKYDYVVVANGAWDITNELGCWQEWLHTYVRGAIVLGKFDPNAIVMWINKDYTKNGYAYLTPFDSERASLVLIATDVTDREIDYYWDLFLYSEELHYTIIEEFKLEHRSGLTYPHSIDNIYFAGNAAGGVEPFLGFGHFNAANTGVFAARAIACGRDYEKLLKDVVDRNSQMRQFRKMYNMLTNRGYDKVITTMKMPGMNQLIYSSNINIPKYGAMVGNIILNKENR